MSSDNKEEIVRSILKNHNLGQFFEVLPFETLPTIGSDWVLRVKTTTRGEFLVKFKKEGFSEIRSRHSLFVASKIPAPKLMAKGKCYQVFEFIGGSTLLSLVLKNDPVAFQGYKEALRHLEYLWGSCFLMPHDDVNSKFFSGNYGKNLKVSGCLEAFMGGSFDYPIVANGKSFEISTRQIFYETLKNLSEPPVDAWSTHGDPRLDNIIVNPDRGVVFIDPREGFNDWIDDLVFLGWQRGFRLVNFESPPFICSDDGFLRIHYESSFPSFVDIAESEALKAGEGFSSQHYGYRGWKRRYHSMVAAVALREIVSIQKRRKMGALGRELPDGAEWFWVTEAARNFALSRT